MTSLTKRLGRAVVVSVLAIAFLGVWLLRTSSGERILPSLIGHGPRPEVQLRQGTYVGNEIKKSFPQALEQFLGIPYGQSTAGERRFRAPLPIGASTQKFDAIEYGDRCPAGLPGQMSENCLYLNVWRPKERPTEKKLPVLVHVYGGSFNFGFDRTRSVDNMVAWSTEPFIGVSFNYRVGALGFLPSSLTAKVGLCNAGLKDQALLLEWVQDNIAEFGGDPDDVTLMGSSAGAHSLGHHLMHNPTKRAPFHKLIIESGGPTARVVYTASNPLHEQQFQEFITELDCQDKDDSRLMHALRYLPSNDIQSASESVFNTYNPSVRWPFQPVIDGQGGFIEQPPISAFRDGKFHKVPILTGFNTNEGAAFTPTSIDTSENFTDFFRTLLPSLEDEDFTMLNELYPDPLEYGSSPYEETREGFGAQFKRTEQAYGHFAYICPVRMTGHFASKDVPVYMYQFAVDSTLKGADHGAQNPFSTYDRDTREVSDTINEVAGSMHAYWTSFITTGDPNKIKGRFPNRPDWPLYEPARGSGKKLVFGEGNDEIQGGKNVGVAVQVADDNSAWKDCAYWWDRTDLFEV
ncbi:Acetylcholinesterase [Hyphodiscus hymeniophilus]|uniref:Carboxylic ester hydrolase n=1 Tax=Hyphodiscus hymeniophilus TaxID=353542 RepID=A0A9P6VS13_9HELO|nr:Acetylcholinesterase [Hyphodiscus hymeniophilus]